MLTGLLLFAFFVLSQSSGPVYSASLDNSDDACTAGIKPGDIDPNFGTAGKLKLDCGGKDGAIDAIGDREGRIIVLGYCMAGTANMKHIVFRINPDGSLDKTFNGNGKIMLDFGADDRRGVAVAHQTDGKIIVATKESVVRLETTGVLDQSFGNRGRILRTDVGLSYITAIATTSDGKILLGQSTYTADNNDFVVARLTSTGSLDLTFGRNGKTVTNFGNPWNIVSSLLITSDGKIVAGGSTGHSDLALAKYTSNGSPDDSFGVRGKVVTNLETGVRVAEEAHKLVEQKDGKLLVSSIGKTVRYNGSGSLDTSFGATVTFGSHGYSGSNGHINLGGQDLVLLPDQRFAIGSSIANPSASGDIASVDLTVFMLNPDGSRDPNFAKSHGNAARVELPDNGRLSNLILSPSGKDLIVVGDSSGDIHLAAFSLCMPPEDGSTGPSTGGESGPSEEGNTENCTTTTCIAQEKNCGTIADGCGESLDCGTCKPPETCGGSEISNVCGRPKSIGTSDDEGGCALRP